MTTVDRHILLYWGDYAITTNNVLFGSTTVDIAATERVFNAVNQYV